MSKGNHVYHKFLASDLADIAVATTVTDGDGLTSLVWEVWDIDAVMIEAYLTAVADSTGAVTFHFARSMDGTNFETDTSALISITMAGAAARRATAQLDTRGVHSLKLYKIANADAAKKPTLLNALVSKTYGHIR